ncbi:MAG: ATP-grasp domain-containing protein [Myxococcota bacterium]|nr:ATP-grasp domain-containing protein [Myxococcota bacterium]
MNILFLNAGRRCELIQAFKKVMPQFGSGRVIATDIVPTAPALAFADRSEILPHSSAKEKFLPQFIALCLEENVQCVIPSIDPDLVHLAKYREEIEKSCPNLQLCLSPPEVIRLCRDKRLSRDKFASLGAIVPQEVEPKSDSLNFPLFLKPAGGSASEGIYRIDTMMELETYLPKVNQPMLEVFVEGPEYTVDVLCAFDRPKAYVAVPRKRLAVRGGEVSRGIVERNPQLEALAKQLAEGFDCRGPVTLQFRRTSDETFVAMELNARVGGGLPLSIAAGAEWPRWIFQMLRGEIPDCSLPLEDGLLMSRYDSSCFIETKRTQRFFEDVDISQSDLLIFDMDDTLYPERDFVFSGYKAVSAKVFIDFGIDIESRLRCAFESGCRGDIFSKVFNQMNFPQPESYIKELVKVYREHQPSIRPFLDTTRLRDLKNSVRKLALISDGWLNTQRLKLEALGLSHYFDEVLFTDELGEDREFWKPHPRAFELLLKRLDVPAEKAAYIGDNTSKDFLAPNQLGITSIQIKRESEGEYASVRSPSTEHEADFLIDSLMRLKICQ